MRALQINEGFLLCGATEAFRNASLRVGATGRVEFLCVIKEKDSGDWGRGYQEEGREEQDGGVS